MSLRQQIRQPALFVVIADKQRKKLAGNIINKTVRYPDHNFKRFYDFDLTVGNPVNVILKDTMGPTDRNVQQAKCDRIS